MRKYLTGMMAALALSAPLSADEPQWQEDMPDTHTVVKGDTLWDISETFLKNPWLWPEIWHVNAQIANPHLIYPGDVIRLIYLDGEKRLTLDTSGRIFKLEPKAHVVSQGEAIETIPLDEINSFLSRSRVVSEQELQLAPYVISGLNEHLIVGAGDKAYVRGSVDGENTGYGIYREGEVYIDPVTDEFLGVQAIDIGSGMIERVNGEISTMAVTRTTEEMRIGDRLLRDEERSIDSTFFPSSPLGDVEGQILAVEGGVNQVGKLDVVVINRGSREQLEVGNVLAIFKRGNHITDRVTGDRVKLPDERAGLVMVFRTFEKVSLALVMDAEQGISVEDIVRNP
ncbi:LysM peptidoglycan-binding domain-containing protein [Agaribacterium haliotis]|uniref:LysM peptidoglycan-binding domain-containing protein n=1 Tax=Agaribacterium haliotis TaxID=2013869 RepID=UPI000BB55D27|nr:LysM peptidoglycan-binding domain-containing protein [Agaribacterium haliotis]